MKSLVEVNRLRRRAPHPGRSSRGQNVRHHAHRLVAAGCLLLAATGPAHAQIAPTSDDRITNVTPSFRPGPYTALSVNGRDPHNVAVATADGYVLWTEDAGAEVHETRALHPRRFDTVSLRGGGKREIAMRVDRPSRATRLFLHHLDRGSNPARHALWMAVGATVTDIVGLSVPEDGGPILVASPSGVLMSDHGRTVWSQTFGNEGPMFRDKTAVMAISIARNPGDPQHVLLGTSKGLYVSHNGGRTFSVHPTRLLADEQIGLLSWSLGDPRLVLLSVGENLLLSEDAGATFNPAHATAGPFNAIQQTSIGALLATTEGLELVGQTNQRFLRGQNVVGAVLRQNGRILAATSEALHEISQDGTTRVILRTASSDPFVALSGDERLAWLVSYRNVLRIGAGEERRAGYRPPRLLIDLPALQQRMLEHTGIGEPERTMLHDRWYAKLLPLFVVNMWGTRENGSSRVQDGLFPIIRDRQLRAQSEDTTEFSLLALWDLSSVVFGDRGDVSNPSLVLESSLRANRKALLEELAWRYRECAGLVAQLRHPPRDSRTELLWRMRLQEHAAYLEFMSGRPVVEGNDLEARR
jgi:hypothetical protein